MAVTVNINGKSLCHKGSMGIAMATIPDVCKTPSPAGPVPIPYPNIARSADLAKGTKKVKADGQSCAIMGSEFARSNGDEPGTAGGVISGVNMSKATWLLTSFNVFFEGKPVARLADKMLMNKMNTVSLGGNMQMPLMPDMVMVKLCEIACECADAPADKKLQDTMAEKIKADPAQYDADGYPAKSGETQMFPEVHMTKPDGGKWGPLMNVSERVRPAGTVPSRRQRTPGGGIRPDILTKGKDGEWDRIVEVKFPGDEPNDNQKPGGKYQQAADDMGVDYVLMDVTKCPCWAAAAKKSTRKFKKSKMSSKAPTQASTGVAAMGAGASGAPAPSAANAFSLSPRP